MIMKRIYILIQYTFEGYAKDRVTEVHLKITRLIKKEKMGGEHFEVRVLRFLRKISPAHLTPPSRPIRAPIPRVEKKLHYHWLLLPGT